MKALFVHRTPTLASARVRVLALVPHLRALGIDCETAEHPETAVGLRALLAGTDADVVVLQKKTPNLLEGLAWRVCPVPLVFDYDDAILFRQEPRRGRWESRTRRGRFQRALRLADAFACGNAQLASFCKTARKPVLIAPSGVPLDVPQVRGRRPDAPLRVGWIGAPHNLHELVSLREVLGQLAREIRFELVVISQASVELAGVDVVHVPWSLGTQEAQIAQLDVGLMPLADSPWARGKCAYKLLQYMAAGVPAIGSAVGMNRDVIAHGENGWLADSPDAFGGAIRTLHEQPDLACRLGAAGRATVVERFGFATVAGAWRDFLDDLTSG